VVLVSPVVVTLSAQVATARTDAEVPEDERAFSQATQALAHGRTSEAEAVARARGTGDQVASALRAQLAIRRGEYAEARRMLEPVVATHPSSEAALELGLLQMMLGDKAVGRRTLSTILGDARTFRTAGELLRAARAARALGQVRSANALFREAAALAPGDPAINTAWGDLFFEKHQAGDAQQSYQTALGTDPEWAPAHAGLARVLAADDPPAAGTEAARALEIDQGLVDPRLLQAELALDADKDDDARRFIDDALAINPNQLDLHALRAAMAYVEDRQADYEAEVARTLAINPTYGDVYRVAGNHAARRYRFDEAVELVRKAIALEPDNMAAYADLGMHLLRTGEEAEARRVLDRAFQADPYDVVTYNLLGLLDSLKDFRTFKTDNAVVRLSPAEAEVLKEYALPIVDQSFADLEARYQFTPTGPILVEIFPRHDDFAVRTLGLPGMIGALGACFGRVVTLDSPRARTPGTFNWNATLYHELAHVFTLQLSKQRVPRWLTEGASVYEEGRVRKEWAQEMEVPFARWYHLGKAPKIRDLDAAFTRPDTIALAYFQASLVVEQIVETYGMPGLRGLLVAYGDGLDTEAAVQRALGVGLDALQKTFDERLAGRFGALGDALQVPDGVSLQGLKDPAEARRLAASHPGSYPVQLAAGRVLAATDPAVATATLERAAALVPMATGSDSPHGVLAALAEKQGDPARAMRELRLLLTHDHTNVEAARSLAALASTAGDQALERFALERVVMLDPYDPGAHTAFGHLALQSKDVPLATREFQAALAAGPVDLAAAHCDLGETYFLAGRKDDAKRQALAALEIAPTFERAQDLLLKIVEGDH